MECSNTSPSEPGYCIAVGVSPYLKKKELPAFGFVNFRQLSFPRWPQERQPGRRG